VGLKPERCAHGGEAIRGGMCSAGEGEEKRKMKWGSGVGWKLTKGGG